MIKVYDFLWLRIAQYGAKYQSGQNVVATFNGALAEVQLELYNQLAPHYQANEKIRELLNVWVKKINTPITNGVYTVDSSQGTFDRVISMAVTDPTSPFAVQYPISPIMEGEVVYASRIPQRAPSLAKKCVYYIMDGPTTIDILPVVSSLPVLLYYLVFPADAKIAFTYSETDDEDIMTLDPDNTVDLAWTQDASNLILYMMLEKYGVTVREQLLLEYSKLGIAETLGMGKGDNQ